MKKYFLIYILSFFTSVSWAQQDIDYPLPEESTEKKAKQLPDVNPNEEEPGAVSEGTPGNETVLEDKDPILEAQKEAAKPKKKKEVQNFKDDEEDISDLSQLGSLAPFKDIAVIQKRFLPKTQRFEFYPNLGAMVNNPFFFNTMLGARLGYSITEKFGVEAIAGYIMSSKQRVTKDLQDDKRIYTSSYVIPELYLGADVRWSPIYGKMGYFNKSIVPFDMYFSAGAGITTTNQDTSPVTFHFGTGQIFALSKKMAARWDVSAFMYSSDTSVPDSGVTNGSFIDLYVSLGLSFFFPEASYR